MKAELLPKDFEGKCWRVAEESAELIKVLSKIQRFGFMPTFEGVTYNNIKDALNEIRDLRHAINILELELNLL